MIVLAIIIAAIGLFLLLRFGVTIVYGQDGLKVTAIVGIIPIKIYPSDKKKLKKKPKKKEKVSLSELIDMLLRRKKEDKKPGKFETFLQLLNLAKNTLNRIRKKLLIKKLDIHFVSAGKDPMQTALMFGSANVAYGVLEPILERYFRLRRFNFTSDADFEKTKPLIYVRATFSIAVWEVLYVMRALISKPAEKNPSKNVKHNKVKHNKVKHNQDRKENTENGKSSD